RAEIDAAAGKVLSAQKCEIEHVKANGGTLSFERMDEALPMPIDERAEAALNLAPVLEDLSRCELRVTGLSAGTYEVSIDGELAAKTSSEELAKGLNLANAAGPITKQAREVLKLVFEKNNLFFHRWREVQLFDFPKWAQGTEVEGKRKAEISKVDQQIAGLEGQIEKARKPKSHHFELKP